MSSSMWYLRNCIMMLYASVPLLALLSQPRGFFPASFHERPQSLPRCTIRGRKAHSLIWVLALPILSSLSWPLPLPCLPVEPPPPLEGKPLAGEKVVWLMITSPGLHTEHYKWQLRSEWMCWRMHSTDPADGIRVYSQPNMRILIQWVGEYK